MNHLSDQEFLAYLERMERGEALPAGLPADDAADLELAGRLLAQQMRPSRRLVLAVQQSMMTPSSASPPSLAARLKAWKRRLPMSTPQMSLWKRLVWGGVALILALALVVLAFPGIRAAALEALLKIGGVGFVETDQGPSTDDAEIWSEQIVSLAAAQAILPFAVPTWAPEGYVLKENEVTVARPYTDVLHVMLKWEKTGGPTIYFEVWRGPSENWELQWMVGNDAVETILVNGQEVALVRGGWDHETHQYGPTPDVQLVWKERDLYYSLAVHHWSLPVPVEDLVQMIESMPR